MKTIVVTGPRSCGKSRSIYELASWLTREGWQDDSEGLPFVNRYTNDCFSVAQMERREDICQLFTNSGKMVLLYASMDDRDCVCRLREVLAHLEKIGREIDLLVTTLRRYDDPQYAVTLIQMGWREMSTKLVDADGQEIIQIPLLRVKFEYGAGKRERVVEWYNQKTARQLQLVVSILANFPQ